MQKIVRVTIAVILFLVFSLPITADTVQAKNTDSLTIVDEGSWTDGTKFDVSGLMDGKPDWLQLISTSGVKINRAGEICHPFPRGQFGWVGEIREYKNAHWIKIATSNAWVPNTEGTFMSCIQASEAGIYALFGYYVQPEGYFEPGQDNENSFDCSTLTWEVHVEHTGGITLTYYGTVTGLPEGTEIDMTINSSKSDPNTLSGSTSTTVDVNGSYNWLYLAYVPSVNHMFVDYSVPAYGCTYSYDHEF